MPKKRQSKPPLITPEDDSLPKKKEFLKRPKLNTPSPQPQDDHAQFDFEFLQTQDSEKAENTDEAIENEQLERLFNQPSNSTHNRNEGFLSEQPLFPETHWSDFDIDEQVLQGIKLLQVFIYEI